jgi:FkbM family methyltransferase
MIPLKDLITRHNLKITGVFHIGANEGQERYSYDELIKGEILWFEALDFVFDKLKDNISVFPNQVALNACLSDVDGKTVAFNVSDNEAQSSSMLDFGVHEEIHPSVHFIDCVPLKTTRFDTLMNLLERNVSKINTISIDVQGSELKVLNGFGKYLNQIDYIISEVNKKLTYKNCALVEELDEFLSDFKRVETGDWVGDSWTDALYVRKTLL